MHAAGIIEKKDTFIISDLSSSSLKVALSCLASKADKDIMTEYGSVGARHLQQLAEMSTLPDKDLYADVHQIAEVTNTEFEVTFSNMRTLLATHAQEWRAYLESLGKESFLNNWMEGGRYGGPK